MNFGQNVQNLGTSESVISDKMSSENFFWERQGASFWTKCPKQLSWAKIEKKWFGNVRERLFGQNVQTFFPSNKLDPFFVSLYLCFSWFQSNPDVAFSCLRSIKSQIKVKLIHSEKWYRTFCPKRRSLTFPNDFFSIFAQESCFGHFVQKDAPWRSHMTSGHFVRKDAFRSSQVFG